MRCGARGAGRELEALRGLDEAAEGEAQGLLDGAAGCGAAVLRSEPPGTAPGCGGGGLKKWLGGCQRGGKEPGARLLSRL